MMVFGGLMFPFVAVIHDLNWTFDRDYIIRIVAAVVLGAAVGLERELRDKPAGFRTIILICLGACLFSIVSQSIGGPDANTTRIAAQIVAGIGFIGAGAILRDRHSIIGLTTAATIWAIAAVGMATGFGLLGLAIAGTVAILIALWFLSILEDSIGDRRDMQDYAIVTANDEAALERLNKVFATQRIRVLKRRFYEDGPSLVVEIMAIGSKTNHDRVRLSLARSSEYTLRKP
jgi:putative Mg2+ transporter-C (MgtC) family protein